MLRVFHFDVYDLLDSRANLSFVTPYLAMKFDISLEILLEPLPVYTLVGNSVLTKKVSRNCLVSVFHKVTSCDLVEFDMTIFMLSLVWIGFMHAMLRLSVEPEWLTFNFLMNQS